jgi:VWFA-related protein
MTSRPILRATTHTVAAFACIGAIGAASLGRQIPAAATPPLLIDVVAVDRNGRAVSDLKPGELEVWINRYRVPVSTLTVVAPSTDAADGRVIGLLLDDLTLAPAIVPRARDVARRFVEQMRPGDQVSIVTLSGSEVAPTGDRGRLLQAVASYSTRSIGVLRLDLLSAQILETVTALSRQLAETSDRKKTIVAVGAAWLFDTPIPPPTVAHDLRREWTAAMRATAAAHVNLYVIDPSGVGMSRTAGGSSGFAGETGGYAFTNTNDLTAAADRILREADSYYVVEVPDPPVGRKSELRDLEVRVLRRGVSIQARRALPGLR